MINVLPFTNLGDVYDFCINDVGVVCNKLGETIVFFNGDDVDVFFDNVDVKSDFDAEVGYTTCSPEPTAQDNDDFKQFNAVLLFCLLMFAFFASLFGND